MLQVMLCSFVRHVARSRALLGYGVFLAVTTQGCKSKPVASKAPVQQNAPVSLKPLQAATLQVNLDLRDAPDAELLIPRGITKPSPVVLVLGENAANLASSCAKWGKMVGEGHFVLCQCASSEDLQVDARADAAEHALKAALRVTKRRFGAYVSAENVTLVGVDIMGTVVAAMMRKSPAFFSRVALLEQGFAQWTAVDSARFATISTANALLMCSSKQCELEATRVAVTLRASGVKAMLLLNTASAEGKPALAQVDSPDFRAALAQLLAEPKSAP